MQSTGRRDCYCHRGAASVVARITPPAYLNGSLAGEFGFDPLGLGQDPEDRKWYMQAELVHARFAMAGIAGILFTYTLRATGRIDVPLWFAETKRWMDFIKPGSQAAEDSFGFEPALKGLDNGYPGGPIFNPLGFANDPRNSQPMRWKEIKNGKQSSSPTARKEVQSVFATLSGICGGHESWVRTSVKAVLSEP